MSFTTNRNNYYEASHYTEDIGDMIIDRIFNGVTDEKLESQGFGFYVTGENYWNEFQEAMDNH